jgi:D-alanyl-D-alanine carboxypeptidase
MTPDMQAPIGSITKTFTVLIALHLVGQGSLRLDDTIDHWYPWIDDASLITVKMLMNHSSGIADIGQQQVDLHCADPDRFVDPEELIEIGAALPRAPFAPGDGFLYSSTNTIILGRILEKVTNQSYVSLISEHLLEPLRLRRTKLDTDGRLDPPFSHGYTDFCPNRPPDTDTSRWVQFSFAAGALASTLDDLHAWGVALGEGFGVTKKLRHARIDDVAPGSNTGLGVVIQFDPRTNYVISLGHAGSEPGYSANVQYYTCSGAVWALIGNGMVEPGKPSWPFSRRSGPLSNLWSRHPPAVRATGTRTPGTIPAIGTSGDRIAGGGKFLYILPKEQERNAKMA